MSLKKSVEMVRRVANTTVTMLAGNLAVCWVYQMIRQVAMGWGLWIVMTCVGLRTERVAGSRLCQYLLVISCLQSELGKLLLV